MKFYANKMEGSKSILHELYVFSEWKPEPEYIQKPDNILPENISALWRWLKFLGPKKSLIDSITAFRERQQKWLISLGDEGKVIAVLADNILEIRRKRSEYATIAARTTVNRDAYAQWRKLAWSPDCSFVALAYGNGVVSFFDLTASNLFSIPIDCSRPGGLECTDNTHAVAEIIFMPLRVKDNKWNWEVLVMTYDGKLRGFLVSQTDGYKLQHTFHFPGGVSSLVYCAVSSTIYTAGLPRSAAKDPSSPLSAGITAWRILNDDPFYKLSVVSDQLEAQLANERFQIYIPFVTSKNMPFIVKMVISPDSSKLVCLHCNGDISIWRLPLLKLLYRHSLVAQPGHDVRNPLLKTGRSEPIVNHAADVNWWSNEEIILSRFSGAVTVCRIEDMVNILGKKPEFFQGSPQVTRAYEGSFMALECESNVMPAKKSRSDQSMEVVKIESDIDDSMLELTKELFKTVLYAITDMETFQPKPKRITVVSRIYRLLGVKSTTPTELFSRKIESGSYSDALSLAQTFSLDSDLVYQQQWRKNPVSTDAIHKYLSKVSKKIWAVHQCVDRLPETLPAAKELLEFGLHLTNEEILQEINKDRSEDQITNPDDISPEDLNAYSSELLRCRHVILFYKERLKLYESIIKCEKSSYAKEEYDRLRSHCLVHSAIEIAKEGRIEALAYLWSHIEPLAMQLSVLDHLPESLNPVNYSPLLPCKNPSQYFENVIPPKETFEHENDWCRNKKFRSIWSSNWSEDSTSTVETPVETDVSKWFEKRAREIEERSGLVSYALDLVLIGTQICEVQGLEKIVFYLKTLNVLIYDINVTEVTLKELEKMTYLEICSLLTKRSTPATFVSDLKQFVVPFLKRSETVMWGPPSCVMGLVEFFESLSVNDLSYILLVLQSPKDFELDVRTRLDIVERCLYAHTRTDQLSSVYDLLNTVLKESDGTISPVELVSRVQQLERVVTACGRCACRDIRVSARSLRDLRTARSSTRVRDLFTQVARSVPAKISKPTPQDWEKLLNDLLELQSSLFTEQITKVQCYEIYASSLLTSGDAASIGLASDVLTCKDGDYRNSHYVSYVRSVQLALNASHEYFDSASSLQDPAIELARCCLNLIKDDNAEVQQGMDLISALKILSEFNLDTLPMQVRYCVNKKALIESCLKSDPNAYLASHKLLKLAKLLRIADDDEQAREALVLQLVGEYAMDAVVAGGAGAGGAAAEAARRLAALRRAGPGAATLLARVAGAPHTDTAARSMLYAAAVTYCDPQHIQQILTDRLSVELEGLQQMGAALKDHGHVPERCPSTDDEFADAITTPVIEKKDLIAPTRIEKKVPLFNYLLGSIHNKFTISNKATTEEAIDRSVHCQEFYSTLYPEHQVSNSYYRYDRFSIPDPIDSQSAVGQSVLKWYYIQNCLEDGVTCDLEGEVVQKCAEQIMYRDTALSVACLLRRAHEDAASAHTHSHTALAAALYATLLKCNAPELRDNVYLTPPSQLARITLKNKNASEEQMKVIRQCIDKLTGMGEVDKLRQLGYNVNGLLFNADEEYRQEVIYRVARSTEKQNVEVACALASKYGMDVTEVWLQHAAADRTLQHVAAKSLPVRTSAAYQRIKEVLWPVVSGTEHNALITYYSILREVDDKSPAHGLTPTEHIKLLKKAKSASPDLDYKLLLEQPSAEEFTSHLLEIIKPENVGLLTKFLRTLPPAIKIPITVNTLYTKWLTKYFFSVGSMATSKKWMQQYRQCASYFNKLFKQDLLRFLDETCFGEEAVNRIPAGTRNLMLMQAVDYCHQEEENDFKVNKNDQTWVEVGEELTRWARFLENYHSTTVQGIIDATPLQTRPLWTEIEMSHGDTERMLSLVERLVLQTEVTPGAMTSLLQCLHVPVSHHDVLARALSAADSLQQIQVFVTRLMQYHRDGFRFEEELLEKAMQKATQYGLPPHKQIGLLSLSQRTQMQDSGDMQKIASFSVDLFRTEWPDSDYTKRVTEDMLMTEDGKREVFNAYLVMADTWQRKKALVDVLNCWPASSTGDLTRSIHCEYLSSLLSLPDQREVLPLIELLLRRPVLTHQEVKWLTDEVRDEAVMNAIWIILLSDCEHSTDDVLKLILRNKDHIQKQEINDDLIKKLLDSGMFLKLVPTPFYAAIISYIMNTEAASGEPTSSVYTIRWAVSELLKSNYLAEAGHLQLISIGVPAALRGFSQTITYCKNMLKN